MTTLYAIKLNTPHGTRWKCGTPNTDGDIDVYEGRETRDLIPFTEREAQQWMESLSCPSQLVPIDSIPNATILPELNQP